MATAEELIVAIKSEGVGETRDDLQGIEDSMEETAEASQDASEDLEGFTNRIQGAMSAAAAGVAVAAASLLSTVPIIGEYVAGLGAIFDAVGLQVDQLIRDLGGGGLTTILFDVANAIITADDAMADLIGVVGVLTTIITGALAGFAAFKVATLGWVGAGSALIGALKAVGAAIAGVIGGISAVTAALAIAVVAILAFIAAYVTNFKGVRDTTNRILGDVWNTITTTFNDLASTGVKLVKNFVNGVVNWFSNLGSELSDWAGGIATRAYQWGKNLVQSFISGIRSLLSRVQDWLGDLADIGANIGINVPSLPDLGGGGGSSGGGGGGRPAFRGATTGGSGNVYMDGRNLTENTGRYRSDPGRRRGL